MTVGGGFFQPLKTPRHVLLAPVFLLGNPLSFKLLLVLPSIFLFLSFRSLIVTCLDVRLFRMALCEVLPAPCSCGSVRPASVVVFSHCSPSLFLLSLQAERHKLSHSLTLPQVPEARRLSLCCREGLVSGVVSGSRMCSSSPVRCRPIDPRRSALSLCLQL